MRDPAPAASTVPVPFPNEKWASLGKLLSREELRVIRGEARRKLIGTWEDIAQRERALDDRLFLGIIGGTGVGKSTLINAIAGSVISRAGDRRPTTERVVVYRHRRSPLPEDLPREDLAQPEAFHEEEGLERLVVLDFPDFDSHVVDHAALLARFLPRLDVLLLVVDDEKYGDQRLFEVLRALPHAARNLHFVLNKIDRLAERYPSRSKEVAREILSDLTEKLSTHAGFRPGPERLWAISALLALEARSGAGRTEGPERSGADGAPAGDFRSVLALLESYRAEKRRRAAKEANLDARKAALFLEARAVARLPETAERCAAARGAIQERGCELERILEGIPEPILGPREGRRLLVQALRRAPAKLSFPLRLTLPLWGRAGGEAPGPEELAARARAHYLPYLETLKTAEREMRDEITRIAGEPPPQPLGTAEFRRRAEELRPDLDRRMGQALRMARLRAWLFPAVLVAGGLWFALHPLISELVRRLSEGQPVDWLALLARSAAALVLALSPVTVFAATAVLVAAFALNFLLDRRRVRSAVEGAVKAFEGGIRDEARGEALARFAPLSAALGAWERERDELVWALDGSPVVSEKQALKKN